MHTEGALHPSGFRINERERLDRVEQASRVYAVVVSFAPESGLLSLCDQTAGVVKASWMPAAEERGRVLGRQASEKPRGRKPRAGVARRCRAGGLSMGI
jgi:hypothetical protein